MDLLNLDPNNLLSSLGKYASIIKDNRPISPTQAAASTVQSSATTAPIDQNVIANDEKLSSENQTKMFDVGEKQVTEHQCGTPNFLISKGKV